MRHGVEVSRHWSRLLRVPLLLFVAVLLASCRRSRPRGLPTWSGHVSGLDKNLAARGRRDFYDQLTAAERQDLYDAFKDYTTGFDAKHGTKRWNAAVMEGLPW